MSGPDIVRLDFGTLASAKGHGNLAIKNGVCCAVVGHSTLEKNARFLMLSLLDKLRFDGLGLHAKMQCNDTVSKSANISIPWMIMHVCLLFFGQKLRTTSLRCQRLCLNIDPPSFWCLGGFV